MSVADRVRAGHYNKKLQNPTRPESHELLKKPAHQLTANEMAILPALHTQYLAAQSAYEQERENVRTEGQRLSAQFRADLEQENSMTDHPKRDLLWNTVQDYGSDEGFRRIVEVYEELVQLVK